MLEKYHIIPRRCPLEWSKDKESAGRPAGRAAGHFVTAEVDSGS